MKVQIIKDKEGNLIGGIELGGNGTEVEFVKEEGQSIEIIEAPEDYSKDIEKFYKNRPKVPPGNLL